MGAKLPFYGRLLIVAEHIQDCKRHGAKLRSREVHPLQVLRIHPQFNISPKKGPEARIGGRRRGRVPGWSEWAPADTRLSPPGRPGDCTKVVRTRRQSGVVFLGPRESLRLYSNISLAYSSRRAMGAGLGPAFFWALVWQFPARHHATEPDSYRRQVEGRLRLQDAPIAAARRGARAIPSPAAPARHPPRSA